MSLKQTILEHLKSKYPAIIHKGEILRLATNVWGYENENAGRRCRDLVKEGKIKRYENHKHEAEYQYIPDHSNMPQQPQTPPKPATKQPVVTKTTNQKRSLVSVPVFAPQGTNGKRDKSSDFYRPLDRCCEIAILCYEKNLPIQHSRGCETSA